MSEKSFSVALSSKSFAQTLRALERAIAASGDTIFARVDQSAAAAAAGLALRPTMLLLFGNPMMGTPLMAARPEAALDLPLKLLVWDDEGVCVAFNRMEVLAERFPGVELAPLKALDERVRTMVEAAL